ncbi:hypothetical protein C2S53_017722 [Perilla frutescens var. hirtella]|uniref:PGG domain-containing protein n=1 Tax=Perilla frutescens var. hirtella TaxID=608512 RepID=A0AAD4IVY6_PERFH|nr:hypothetical protein C2S53_017722 [Perilla frutescens var. hirtella]
MKRLMRSRSGRQIYGPKWQNIEANREIEHDENALRSASAESIAIASQVSDAQNNQDRTREGNISGSGGRDGESMYRAALEGDWVAAEVLLSRDPTLAFDHITEDGDRALHVATAMKHEEFVQKLVEKMSPSDLELLDGQGYTACCYAAISGVVEIAAALMKKNTNLIKNNVTALQKAAFCGNKEMVSYLLKFTQVEDFLNEQWFDLLLLVVRTKMYDVALELLEKNGSLATMKNEEGTILHLLAREDISHSRTYKGLLQSYRDRLVIRGFTRRKIGGVMQEDLRLLVEKLWMQIKNLEQATALELMKNPPILHDAAKVGNVELITMLTHTYPNLIWNTDNNGYTIFHIAIIYRRENIFKLIHQSGAMKHLITTSQDQNGDTILHLAAKLASPSRRKIVSIPALQMQGELAWFKEVEAIVPPSCLKTRNKDGLTPRELFSKEHKNLLEKSETWMRNTADSCMLIATLMLTVVFAAAFTVPGGNNQETGIPILLKRIWFTCFIIFEAIALFGSTLSIITFWSIMTSSFDEDQFLEALPYQLKLGLSSLLISLVGAVSIFMSAYFLVFVEVRAWLIKFVIIWTYVCLIGAIGMEFGKLLINTSLQRYFSAIMPHPNKKSLFGQYHMTRE